MVKAAIWTGVILTVLGVGGYFYSNGVSPTALIPAGFGLLFIILGVLARKESLRKHVMHAAALLSVLGIIGSFSGTVNAVTLMGGGTVDRPQAAIAQAIMATVCIVFLLLAIRSFVNARLKPGAAQKS